MKRILVPVDFSPVTTAVMQMAASMAATCDAKVFLVHVAPVYVPDLQKIRIPQHERDQVAHELREEHRNLQALAADLTQQECAAEALLVEGSGTVEKILDEAKRLEADLIIVGSHGHGKLYDMLIGSTCEGVLRRAGIPIMIVPAAARDAESGEPGTSG